MSLRAIDCWVNVSMGEQKPPEYLVRVKEDYFKGGDEFFRNIEPEQLIDEMDAAGVEKAVVSVPVTKPSAHALKFAAKYPDRCAYAANVGPTGKMKEVWELEALVRNEPVVMARVVPFGSDTLPAHTSAARSGSRVSVTSTCPSNTSIRIALMASSLPAAETCEPSLPTACNGSATIEWPLEARRRPLHQLHRSSS